MPECNHPVKMNDRCEEHNYTLDGVVLNPVAGVVYLPEEITEMVLVYAANLYAKTIDQLADRAARDGRELPSQPFRRPSC